MLTPKTTIYKIVADIEHGEGNEYVDKTIKMDVTVNNIDKSGDTYLLEIRTHSEEVIFVVSTDKEKYIKGETYTLKIHIDHLSRNEILDVYGVTGHVK